MSISKTISKTTSAHIFKRSFGNLVFIKEDIFVLTSFMKLGPEFFLICCILLVTGIELLFAYLENHVKLWLVILFL